MAHSSGKTRLTRRRRRQLTGVLFIMPAVLLVLAVVIYPLIYSLRLSFTDFNLGYPESAFIGVENFVNAFKNRHFWNGLRISLAFTCLTTISCLVLGMIVALLLHARLKGTVIFRTIALLPMTLSPVVVGIIWMLLLMPDYSFINGILSCIGITGPQWLIKPHLALLSVSAAYVWQWTPFFTLMFLAGMASLPAEPFEAARVDGASQSQIFFFLTLPFLKPVILFTLLIRMMDAFRSFDVIYVMTQGGPGRSTQALSLYAYFEGIAYRNLGYGSAVSYVMLIIVIVMATAAVLLLRRNQRLAF